MTVRTLSQVVCDGCGAVGPFANVEGVSQIAAHELARRFPNEAGWRQAIADRRFVDLCPDCFQKSGVTA